MSALEGDKEYYAALWKQSRKRLAIIILAELAFCFLIAALKK